MHAATSKRVVARQRHWPLLTVLGVLFLGPLIAPLFQATELPLLAWSGSLAHSLLSTYVCPTPAKSYFLLGWPMAVCARCWGATIGLWAAYLLGKRLGGTGLLALPVPALLVLAALAFGLWPLEIIGEAQGWWLAPRWLLVLNGALAGTIGGLAAAALWRQRQGSTR